MSVTIGQQLSDILRRKVEGALVISSEMVADRVRKNINKSPRGGRTYVKTNASGNTRIHKASAPGESPATDLGFLVRSIQVQPDFDNYFENLRIRVVCLHSIAPYARYLEFGTMSGKLQPRPFLFKALQAQKQKATHVVQKAVRDALAQMQGATP